MQRLMLAPLLFLCGCGSLQDMIVQPYEPQPIRIYNQAQFDADLAECRAAGLAYQPRFSFGRVLSKTVSGATSNTSLIPVSPLVPIYGAAGGAVGATSDGLDVMSAQHQNVFRNCLRDETRRDGSAIVADPRD